MCNMKNKGTCIIEGFAEIYAEARKAKCKAMSGKNNHNFGKPAWNHGKTKEMILVWRLVLLKPNYT